MEDSDDESHSGSANTSVHAGFISANTSLLSDYRANDTGDTSDTDYESAAEATDHDLSFDGGFSNYIISATYQNCL